MVTNRYKFGNNIDRYKDITVLRDLQGCLDSGRLWGYLVNQILKGNGFTTTTHDRTICRDLYNPTGETIYLIRQVGEFSLAFSNEYISWGIYNQIGGALQLPIKSDRPFTYISIVTDFN